MSDALVVPVTQQDPATQAEVSPAPTATTAEHMIPKARLDEEIARRKEFEVQIKALSKQQAAGSEAQKQLEAMTAQLEITERRATFLEEAVRPEIECRNPGAAWVIAKAQDLFTRNGSPDWKGIKAAAPELFGKVIANANAGNGTGSPPAPKQDMNSFIRSKGRG